MDEDNIEIQIEKTYRSIEKCLRNSELVDSLNVVNEVERYRQFWRPKKTSVLLLAESHVFTDDKDYGIALNTDTFANVTLNKSNLFLDYPIHFVRFVYCLGYGEDELLNERPAKYNGGTAQFWKIFSACVAESEGHVEHDFQKVLKKGTRSFTQRVSNKVEVLQKMQEKGVWLVDSSVVGLYGSGAQGHSIRNKIIRVCWQNYIANVVSKAGPKHIIVIGELVHEILQNELKQLGIGFTRILQPQARISSKEQLENYKKYQRICKNYC